MSWWCSHEDYAIGTKYRKGRLYTLMRCRKCTRVRWKKQ